MEHVELGTYELYKVDVKVVRIANMSKTTEKL